MRIRWRDFEIPSSVICEPETHSSTYGKFVIEPFERGFGITVGNSLRRILLSSLEGAAVTSVKIEGAQHEFSTLTGVYEDVTDIILNIKGLLLKMDPESPFSTMEIFREKKGEIKAKDIKIPSTVEIVDPEYHIATLTQDIPFRIEIEAVNGRGYSTSDENSKGDTEIGLIWVDSSFSPVSRVRYKTEDTRVGQLTNYDRLILEIWTNGTLMPEMALVESAKILRKHLNPFLQYTDMGYELQHDSGLLEEASAPAAVPSPAVESGPNAEELRRKLDRPISALDLSVRAYNCLEAENIHSITDLVNRTEDDMLKVRNFGKTSLIEIKKKLDDLGLELGMRVPSYPDLGEFNSGSIDTGSLDTGSIETGSIETGSIETGSINSDGVDSSSATSDSANPDSSVVRDDQFIPRSTTEPGASNGSSGVEVGGDSAGKEISV